LVNNEWFLQEQFSNYPTKIKNLSIKARNMNANIIKAFDKYEQSIHKLKSEITKEMWKEPKTKKEPKAKKEPKYMTIEMELKHDLNKPNKYLVQKYLGLPSTIITNENELDILKKNFRKFAIQNHPDKIIHLPKEEQTLRVELLKKVGDIRDKIIESTPHHLFGGVIHKHHYFHNI